MSSPLQRLRRVIHSLDGGAIVAFSGGVDSSVLLAVCAQELGDQVLAITADSESLPAHDRRDSIELARKLGVSHRFVKTHELGNAEYSKNDRERCYHCKASLFQTLVPIAARCDLTHLVFGANLDDQGDFRPGHRAAKEYGVRAPLLEASLTKDEVRAIARELHLGIWNKPSSACLASRIPYGTPIDADVLARVDRAEQFVRALGYPQCRVRHYGKIARLEVSPHNIERARTTDHSQIVAAFEQLGYEEVTVDPQGYRTGSLNEVLTG